MDYETSDRFLAGHLVVLLDDAPAPRPATLVVAVTALSPVTMAEMVRYTCGFVTVCLPADRCDALGLPSLAHDPSSQVRTIAAVSVDARFGVGTGISATDRCTTARVLADPQSTASDLCRPGHVIPMRVPMSAPRGVDALSRQAFAAMDLCGLVECLPAVVSSILVNDVGEVMGNEEAGAFAVAQGYAVLRASDVPAPSAQGHLRLDGVAS